MTNISKKAVSLLLSLILVFSAFAVVPISAGAATETDTLTATLIGSTSSYGNWDNKSDASDAVYAGNSMTGTGNHSGAIQIRSNNNNSGIVTTTSGGIANKIEVVWNGTQTQNNGPLYIYGSDTAYTSASELYGSSPKGTLVAQLAAGTDTEYTFTDDYPYIGIRSYSGALYMTQIQITWTSDIVSHTVTWNNYDGTTLKTDSVREGVDYTYTGDTPVKPSTAEKSYTFTGWKLPGDDTLYTNDAANYPQVTGDLTYTAQFEESDRAYTVTWKNGDETIETDSVSYHATPSFDGTAPTMGPDAQYTYTFDGWTSSLDGQVYTAGNFPLVENDVTYTAHYTTATRSYTVNWAKEDGTVIETDLNVPYGTTPTFNGTVPAKENEGTKTYAFDGWVSSLDGAKYAADALPAVQGDATFTAHYKATYTYTDVEVLDRALTGVTGSTYSDWTDKSTGDSDAVYAGKSAGSNSSIQLRGSENSGIVTTTSGGKAIHVAVTWESHTVADRTLQVYGKHSAYSSPADLFSDDEAVSGTLLGTIVNGTSTELDIDEYEYIGLRSAADAMYLTDVTITWGTESERASYDVTWKNGDTVLYTEEVRKGRSPRYEETTEHPMPAKADDESYSYRFSGWTLEGGDGTVYANNELPPIDNSDVTYQAYFSQRKKGTLVDILTADDLTATTNNYASFSGVSKDNTQEVTSPAVYAGSSARHGSSIQLRATQQSGIVTTTSGGRAANVKVIWDEDTHAGQVLNIYGKDESAYNPSNWTDDPGDLLGTIKYGESTELALPVPYDYIAIRSDNGAVYLKKVEITWDTSTVTECTVTWKNGDDEIYHETVTYGQRPAYDIAYGTPSKPDDTYRYTFTGWNNGIRSYTASEQLPIVKSDITYTATYDQTRIHTISWLNYDGSELETDTFLATDAPVTVSYDSEAPTRTATNYYNFTFKGWKDSSGNRYDTVGDIPAVSGDETFTAIYKATQLQKSGRVVSTTDASITYNTGGKYYMDGDEKKQFTDNAVFTDNFSVDGTVVLGNLTITVTQPTEGVFAHTMYVTGEGTAEDPFVFHPNFIYSNTSVTKISDAHGADIYDVHPGDGFKGKSKIRLRDAYIRFLQYDDMPPLECAHGTNGYMGVSETHYGNRYANENAMPYAFVESDTLYYLGEVKNAHNFSEELSLDTELGGVTPYYIVTWQNWDGSEIRKNRVYQNAVPAYGTIAGSLPTRPDDAQYHYTFSGWTDGTNSYGPDDALPPMVDNITYKATFTKTPREQKFFTGHSLTLEGDIGIYFYIDVTVAGITPDDIRNGDYSVAFNFTWNTSPAPHTDLSTDNIVLNKDNYNTLFNGTYFKIKCNTAVAEMSCIVKADAVVTKTADNSEAFTASDLYSVRDYALSIINNPSTYGNDLVNLAKAMLDYGTKAQTVFNIATAAHANAGVDYTMETVTSAMIENAIKSANSGSTASDMTANTSSFGCSYYGTTTVFLTKTSLRHYYTVTDEGLFNTYKSNTGAFTVDERKAPYMIFELSNIAANQLDTLQEFPIAGQVYYYSVLDYSKRILDSAAADANNKALAMATYWYNYYANLYFG